MNCETVRKNVNGDILLEKKKLSTKGASSIGILLYAKSQSISVTVSYSDRRNKIMHLNAYIETSATFTSHAHHKQRANSMHTPIRNNTKASQ